MFYAVDWWNLFFVCCSARLNLLKCPIPSLFEVSNCSNFIHRMPPSNEDDMAASAAAAAHAMALQNDDEAMPPLEDSSDSEEDSDDGVALSADSTYWTHERRQSRANQMQGNSLASNTHTTWYTEEKVPGGFVKLTDQFDPSCSVTVKSNRVAKAKKLLDPAQVACVLSSRGCHALCTRRCHMTITLSAVKECRQALSHTRHP